MKKLAIVATHPIQYYVPVYKQLAEHCDVKVFYTWGEAGVKPKYDPGFKRTVEWDIPLLEGYRYEFLKNTSPKPGSDHFKGIINPDIIQSINSFGPDAVLVTGWSYSSHLKVMRFYKGKIPVWFRGDSTLLDPTKNWKRTARTLLLKWIYSHINKAFYVGTANKAYFLKHGLKEEQLCFAPHAVDNERFEASRETEANLLREPIGLTNNDILILFAGKFEPKKDPILLLNAFLRMDRPDTHLLFVGNGVLETELKKIASGNPRVHFHDFQNQSNMPVYYQACNLFCLPSKGPGETWGLAINEAMACAKPILVSDKVGCATDLILEGKNGYIFKSEDINSLTDKLDQLCNNKGHLSVMGKYSSEIIKNWSFTKQVKAIEQSLHTR